MGGPAARRFKIHTQGSCVHGALQVMHLERHNLGGTAAALRFVAGEDAVAAAAPAPGRSPWEQTRSVYLQTSFESGAFYQLPTLDDSTWLYVLEHKTMAGREARPSDDALARPLVVCFFQQAEGAAGELVVERTDQSTSGMATQLLTVAELALHLGLVLPHDPERAAGATEKMIEELLSNAIVPRVRYHFEHVLGAFDPHTYKLLDGRDADEKYFERWPLSAHTKYTLAQHLARSHGWDQGRLWNLTKAALEKAVRDGVNPLGAAPVAAPAAPPGPGPRGRGRGGGAAVAKAAVAPGRGRGRGGGPAVAKAAAGRGRGRAAGRG